MTERKSNVELAKEFYNFHAFAFRQAISAANPEERQFAFSADQFDDWAVAAELMPSAVRDASEAEHGSLMFTRHRLRIRMNRAARKGDGLDRAYTIEARGGKWRVVLLERFVVEQPKAIVVGIRQCLERSDRTVEQVNAFLDAQENVSDEERLLCKMRLEMAQMSILSGHQMMEMVIMGFDAAKAPNWKRLRRRMAEVLLREANGGRKKSTPQRKRGGHRR